MDTRIQQLERELAESGDAQTFCALYVARKRAGLIETSPLGEIPGELDDYGFGESFGAAGEEGHYMSGGLPDVAGGIAKQGEPFSREDVKHVIAAEEGENDGDTWVALVELHDGRFGFVEGGCDYTGFD